MELVIPENVRDAALLLDSFFKTHGLERWALYNVQARDNPCPRCGARMDQTELKKPGDKQYLNEAAKLLYSKLPDGHGFVLLVAPFGKNPVLNYISNMQRESAISMLKEWLFSIGESENWMKHIK